MFYHIRITQKSNENHDETKVDLSKDQLIERFLIPYEKGLPIIINGKTIPSNDIERVKISKSKEPTDKIIPQIEYEDRNSNVIFVGGPSYKWRAASRAEDITDELILGPPGFKAEGSKNMELNEKTQKISTNKVFIVHGRDNALKNDIERFLNEVGLQPIVLHRQPDEGLTIIEKFEKHSDVTFALILLTPDDVGCLSTQLEKAVEVKSFELRARQNVVFEFGYFIGKLGRSRVCCVYKEGVTLPSDLSGLLYKKVLDDVDEIAYGLIREMKNAGLEPKMLKSIT